MIDSSDKKLSEKENPSYAELLSIGWLTYWRSSAIIVPLFIFFTLVSVKLPSWAGTLLNLLLVVLSVFVVTPFVAHSLLKKRFEGFRVCLLREN